MNSQGVVHIVDDDQGVRDSLSMLVDSDGMRVRVYGDGEAFLAQVDLGAPGCVVADVRMPGISGIDLLRRLQSKGSALPVVVITGHAHVALAVQALKEGAADFIEKPFDDTLFLNSVRSAMRRGEQAFAEQQRVSTLQSRRASLTPRELEVMRLIVQGLSNKAAAAELDISVRTVEIHRARVMDKMAAPSLSALVRMALELDELA